MDDEHKTRNNPNGSVRQCDRKEVHDPHEYQAQFGDYYDMYCPGIQLSAAQRGTIADKAKEQYRLELAQAVGAPKTVTWHGLLNYVTVLATESKRRW